MPLPIDDIIKAAKKVFTKLGRDVDEQELKNIAKHYNAGNLKNAEDKYGKGFAEEEIVPLIQELDDMAAASPDAPKLIKMQRSSTSDGAVKNTAEENPELDRKALLIKIKEKYAPNIKKMKEDDVAEKEIARKKMQEAYASGAGAAGGNRKQMLKILESRFTGQELDDILKKMGIED